MGRISPRSGRMATAGVQLKEILDAFAHSEWLADWDEGVVTHGEGMCPGLLSRTDAQRLFTGPLREAVLLSGRRCTWAACHVPGSVCQADHVLPWSNAGPTSTANGTRCAGTTTGGNPAATAPTATPTATGTTTAQTAPRSAGAPLAPASSLALAMFDAGAVANITQPDFIRAAWMFPPGRSR